MHEVLDHELTRERVVQVPAPPLRFAISHYAGFRGRIIGGLPQTALPSRHAHLIISLAQPINVLAMPNPAQRPGRFQMLVNGLQDAPALVGVEACASDMIHVFLRPPGVQSLLGVPCGVLANGVIELSELWGAAAPRLQQRLLAARNWAARFATLDAVFTGRLQAASPRREIAWAWRHMAQAGGQLPVHQVAGAIGWSRRHFSAQFAQAFGIAPKTAARIFRFERACRLLMDAPAALAEVAALCGYEDQAHMTHEWRAFAGSTPGAWLKQQLPFLQDDEIATGDDAPQIRFARSQ